MCGLTFLFLPDAVLPLPPLLPLLPRLFGLDMRGSDILVATIEAGPTRALALAVGCADDFFFAGAVADIFFVAGCGGLVFAGG